MNRPWLRAVQKLEFRAPAPYLARLRELEYAVAQSPAPYKLRSLRTNALKEARELREAALFCYGMSARIGQTVYLARGESQDYDFVASWIVENEQHFAPVQLKELVPDHVNPSATLSGLVSGLRKYVSSPELTVAIHINRQLRFEPSALLGLELPIASLWAFAAASPDQSNWQLWGNFLEEPSVTSFTYPEA